MMPKQIPATTYAIASDFIVVMGSRVRPQLSSSEDLKIRPDAAIEPHKQCVTYQGVADGHLGQIRQPPKHLQIVQVKVMPGIDAQAKRARQRSSASVTRIRRLGRRRTERKC